MQIEEWIALQRALQIEAFGLDPVMLEGDALGEFVTWNAYALADELHELTAEIQWKPWAKQRGTIIDSSRALGEVVDIMHFLGNLILAFKIDPEHIAEAYAAKVQVNIDRQKNDYDAMSGKCPSCKRDLKEAGTAEFMVQLDGARFMVTQCDACFYELERRYA